MRHVLEILLALTVSSSPAVVRSDPGTGACYYGDFGQAIDCGGGYVVPGPPAPPSHPSAPAPAAPVVLTYVVFQGPNGPCLALAPMDPNTNATVLAWLASVNYPPCPANRPPGPAVDPQTLAVRYWKTVPLPVPRPTVPPGYAVTGKTAYLVTHGTVDPAPYVFDTPLGQLTINATGQYDVNWGDQYQPGIEGPYAEEGQPYPDGHITHTYDYVGTYTIDVIEHWTAVWHLAGATGTLTGLQTVATIPNFRVEQLQAVVTN